MIKAETIIKTYLNNQNVSASEWPEITNPTEELENDPFLIKDSREWLNMLYLHRNDEITIVGDYDADGVLASTVMRKGLSILSVGSKLNTYVPTRMDGYGITPVSVEKIKAQFPNTQTIVTVDNGVAAFEGIQAAKDNGWTVLVTDHHLAKDDGLPIADALVDINRPGDNYPFKGISGTAMAYKMVKAYALILNPSLVRTIDSLRLLVGISTITDMMPLRHENRYWVKYATNEVQEYINGLQSPHADIHIFTLIQALIKTGNLYNKTANTDTFGFTIGPILNSPSRVTGTPQQAYDFFAEKDSDAIIEKAVGLIQTNTNRKNVIGTTSGKIASIIKSRIENGEELNALAVITPLTSGFVGLVAGNLLQKFGKPSIAFATTDFDGVKLTDNDIIHGSARSPKGISIIEVLKKISEIDSDILVSFGGHAAAAGLAIKYNKFDTFASLFNDIVTDILNSQPKSLNTNAVDAFTIRPEDASFKLVSMIESMAPFGEDFPRPKFILEDIPKNVSFMGNNSQHIKFQVLPTFEVIDWNGSEDFNDDPISPKNCEGAITISEFRGRKKLQMIVDNWV